MAVKELAPHEKLEVHEILIFKTACATKSKVMLELAEDKELKEMLKEDIRLSAKAIKELRDILEEA